MRRSSACCPHAARGRQRQSGSGWRWLNWSAVNSAAGRRTAGQVVRWQMYNEEKRQRGNILFARISTCNSLHEWSNVKAVACRSTGCCCSRWRSRTSNIGAKESRLPVLGSSCGSWDVRRRCTGADVVTSAWRDVPSGQWIRIADIATENRLNPGVDDLLTDSRQITNYIGYGNDADPDFVKDSIEIQWCVCRVRTSGRDE